MECLLNNSWQIASLLDEVVVLSTGSGDAQDIGLLESIIPNLMGGNLSREHHDGYGVHKGRHHAGNNVGCSRTRSDQADPGFTRRPSIPVGCMKSPLLVTHQDVFDLGIVCQQGPTSAGWLTFLVLPGLPARAVINSTLMGATDV